MRFLKICIILWPTSLKPHNTFIWMYKTIKTTCQFAHRNVCRSFKFKFEFTEEMPNIHVKIWTCCKLQLYNMSNQISYVFLGSYLFSNVTVIITYNKRQTLLCVYVHCCIMCAIVGCVSIKDLSSFLYVFLLGFYSICFSLFVQYMSIL